MLSFRQTFASVFALLISASWQCAAAGANNLRLPTQTNGPVVLPMQIDPGNSQRPEYLQVFVGERSVCCTGRSPVAGHYSFNSERNSERGVVFKPAFDFVEGQTYTIKTKTGDKREFIVEPVNQESLLEVVSIFPSGEEIPENTLRFYIHFPAPMKPQVSAQYIELRDANGVADHAAFMRFKQELWSQDRRRLTLLLDPGRIKRGIAQNLTLGPALSAGNHYSLVVKGGWPVAGGSRGIQGIEKRFLVSDALNTVPDIGKWRSDVPAVFTRDPLELHFDRTFDFALVQQAISVLDAAGEVVTGEVFIGNAEQRWQFKPHNVWTTEEVQIVVDAWLEDVAGNNFNELLDRPLHTKKTSAEQSTFKLKLRQPGAGT